MPARLLTLTGNDEDAVYGYDDDEAIDGGEGSDNLPAIDYRNTDGSPAVISGLNEWVRDNPLVVAGVIALALYLLINAKRV